ncbi:MAG: hypothetical protein KC620_22100, partial [Myxococcales bacterium]|nr:hypothetical protein [Myxococcales bacterium]
MPLDLASLRRATPTLTDDPAQPGALTDGTWRIWPAADGLERALCDRLIPLDAFAVAPDGVVLDPLGGLADLRDGRLRVPEGAIERDGILGLRVPALACELGLRIDSADIERLIEQAPTVMRAPRAAQRFEMT